MKFHHRSVVGQLLPLLLVVGSTYAQDTTTTATTTTTTTMEEPQCGIYMAGSTLGDTTNLGMYAGHDIPPGAEVQQEIAIPLLFRNWDGPDYYDTTDGELWDRYIWEGEVANLETYDNTDALQSKAVFVPGIGCTINSMLDMNNVESTHGSTYDLAGLHRSKDPGSGAFTPYYNTHTTSVEHIPAGSEIFAAYGDTWIPDIPGAQITFNGYLEDAERFLRDDYYRFVQDRKKTLKPKVLEGLWNFTRDFPVTRNHIFSVLPRNVEWKEVASVLEDKLKLEASSSSDEDEEAADENTGDEDSGPDEYDPNLMVTRHFIRKQGMRSIEWLKEHGRCTDHIRVGTSKIPQAGRGAFANRNLPKGTIVGYSPLIHVGLEGEDLYTIPYGKQEAKLKLKKNGEDEDDSDDQTIDKEDEEDYEMFDLVVNYSFNHKDSTLFLTPYGGMINYINHAPADKANVRVVWPDKEMVAHKPDFLLKDPTELRHTLDKIGLSFDYIALRDIQEGEEILMDYGPEWVEAWREHVQEWEPLEGSDKYVHSSEWPADEPLRTAMEQRENPYPENLELMCVESYHKNAATGEYIWSTVLRPSSDRVPCEILERHAPSPAHGNMPLYKVELYLGNDDDDDESATTIIIDQVPHANIYLTDVVKSADWHMPNVFRHPIGIPDDLLPDIWKNLGGGTAEKGEAKNKTFAKMGAAMKEAMTDAGMTAEKGATTGAPMIAHMPPAQMMQQSAHHHHHEHHTEL